MENDLSNHEVSQASTVIENTISHERKMTIINLMFVKKQGATFLENSESIKSFPLVTDAERDFVDEVYKKIKELNIGEDVTQITNAKQIKEQLYEMCQIPSNVVEEVKKKAKERAESTMQKIAEDKTKWDEQDAEGQKKYGRVNSIENAKGITDYKKDLYQPETLCGRAIEVSERPYVERSRYTEDRIVNISPKKSYQFADRTYTIKKVGVLFYMSTPNLRDNLSEYEITISRDNISKTISVFGEISFDKMSDPYYNAAVFLQLLGANNLTDRELHGYIGSLEQVRDEAGNLKNEYKMVHSPEEYTAVVVWEQIEKAKREMKGQEQNKSLESGEKAAGGEVR